MEQKYLGSIPQNHIMLALATTWNVGWEFPTRYSPYWNYLIGWFYTYIFVVLFDFILIVVSLFIYNIDFGIELLTQILKMNMQHKYNWSEIWKIINKAKLHILSSIKMFFLTECITCNSARESPESCKGGFFSSR